MSAQAIVLFAVWIDCCSFQVSGFVAMDNNPLISDVHARRVECLKGIIPSPRRPKTHGIFGI